MSVVTLTLGILNLVFGAALLAQGPETVLDYLTNCAAILYGSIILAVYLKEMRLEKGND